MRMKKPFEPGREDSAVSADAAAFSPLHAVGKAVAVFVALLSAASFFAYGPGLATAVGLALGLAVAGATAFLVFGPKRRPDATISLALFYAFAVAYAAFARFGSAEGAPGLASPLGAAFAAAWIAAALSLLGLSFAFRHRDRRAKAAADKAAGSARKEGQAKKKEKLTPVAELLSWVEAIAFAAVVIVFFNAFLFQLYEIPSESMVPRFLKFDRVVVDKLTAGPRLPLTNIKLPALRSPVRGDVVVVRNTRYDQGDAAAFKYGLVNLAYTLTFTAVKPDMFEPSGEQRADPLVKRVVGMPGEKLCMADDVVYVKTPGGGWEPLAVDGATYSKIDLYKEDAEIVKKIERLPLDRRGRESLRSIDAAKDALDEDVLAVDFPVRVAALLKIAAVLDPAEVQVLSGLREARFVRSEKNASVLRDLGRFLEEEPSLVARLASDAALRDEARSYFLSWKDASPAEDPASVSARRLGLLIKKAQLELLEADLRAAGADAAAYLADPSRAAARERLESLTAYLYQFRDFRCFPEFPSGEGEYLAAGHYFLMGDNRYNSLDFRHAGSPSFKDLDPSDPASVRYLSLSAPRSLSASNIEGFALARVWPPSRFGAVK